MKHILAIAMKDIRETLRDKMTFFFLLLMPIIFTVMFGFAFGGGSGGGATEDTRLPVALLDQDGSAVSAGLARLLEQSESIRVEAVTGDAAALEAGVLDGTWSAAITVPAGYGASLAAGQPVPVGVLYDPANGESMAAQNAVQTAVMRAVSAGAAVTAADLPFEPGFARAIDAWQQPPVTVQDVAPALIEEESSGPTMPFSHTAPAMMVQFALAGLISAAQVIVRERRTRCLSRLLTTRAARHEILLGHFTAIFLTILGQFVLLVAFGQLILKLDYLRQPLATLLVMVCTALFVAAVGILIGALAKNEDQVIIFSLVPMFVLSALGGAWMPLEFTEGAFRAVGQVTPVALAMDGFKNIIARGLAFDSVLLPAAALVGYAVLFFTLAVWKFKYE